MALVDLSDLIAAAQRGHLVCFPTDTVPALAVHPEQAEHIFAAKQRDLHKPLILMGADISDLCPFFEVQPSEQAVWQQMIGEYWPGAVTLILPVRNHSVARLLNPLDPGSLGFRIPDHSIARSILEQTGPLATTSANLSGQPALEDLGTIATTFPQIHVLHPGQSGASGSGQPSTVVRWTGNGWDVLRQGLVTIQID